MEINNDTFFDIFITQVLLYIQTLLHSISRVLLQPKNPQGHILLVNITAIYQPLQNPFKS